jgi:hypothetical protein
MWKFQTHAPVHIAYRQIRAEPLIFDVNGDGIQDVVVGTSDGYVYALRGNPTNVNGEELWHTRTFGGVPDSVWPDSQGRLVRESHYEEVRGMGVGNLYGSDRTHATIAVCSSALQESGASPLTGHLLILDLGPGTWSANAADWPQWQRTAQRTGTLGVQ